MPLHPGTRLGQYEIVTPLGAGGMGEVYRARDSRLQRDVAVKVLPEMFASDQERAARFAREAQVLAAVNHPHIAQIYGLEQVTGNGTASACFIAMELVDGEDLSQRIARGPMPLDEALAVARQIAVALEAAHDQGIVHRDLKPANVKIRPDGVVKVLDFGLAKAVEPVAAGNATMSPTLSVHATQAGIVLGTAAYMAPEQARGRPVDRRADIWAFGAVLYEMLTGRRAFEGDDISITLAAVLKDPVDFSKLPHDTPPFVRDLLRRCLERDPQKRLPHIGVARIEIDEGETVAAAPAPVSAAGAASSRAGRLAATAVVAGLVGAAISGTAMWRLRPAPRSEGIVRFSIALPNQQALTNMGRHATALSPDGTRLAYVANETLYVQDFSDVAPRAIVGPLPLGLTNPAFSPDGQQLLFYENQQRAVMRVNARGGRPSLLLESDTAPNGIHWTGAGIFFGLTNTGVVRVTPNGRERETVVSLPDEIAADPQLLPDGRSLLFSVYERGANIDAQGTVVLQMLGTTARKTVIARGNGARYVPSGHILYAVGGLLYASAFDLARQEVTGEPIVVAEGVRYGPQSRTPQYSASDSGALVVVPGPVTIGMSVRQFVAVDATGTIQKLDIPGGRYIEPRVSPDGKRLAFTAYEGNETASNVWVYELSGSTAARRLTFGGRNRFPVWSPDGQRIAFQSDRETDLAVFWQPSDGSGAAERLTRPETGAAHIPTSISPDGSQLLIDVKHDSEYSVRILSLRDRQLTPFDVGPSSIPTGASFSPDGRWVLYQTAVPASAIFVQPFPPTGAKYQVANAIHPVWTRDGSSIVYTPRGRFESVRVTTHPSFGFTKAEPRPRGGIIDTGPQLPAEYDTVPGGHVIGLAAQSSGDDELDRRVNVVLHWADDLKRKATTP